MILDRVLKLHLSAKQDIEAQQEHGPSGPLSKSSERELRLTETKSLEGKLPFVSSVAGQYSLKE